MISNAQLSKKIVYYYNGTNGEIRMGLPEQFPSPSGFQKIVCTSANEAERWSDRLRKYNMFKESLKDQERELIEGQWRSELRRHIHHLMTNARNNFNRDAMRHLLVKLEKGADRTKMSREEYLHSEGHEHGR